MFNIELADGRIEALFVITCGEELPQSLQACRYVFPSRDTESCDCECYAKAHSCSTENTVEAYRMLSEFPGKFWCLFAKAIVRAKSSRTGRR